MRLYLLFFSRDPLGQTAKRAHVTIRTALNDATLSRRLVHTRPVAMSPGPNRFRPDSARAAPTATAPAVYQVLVKWW